MAADDDKIEGPRLSRRGFLGAAAAAPLLATPAAAAASQALAPVGAAAARQAMAAIPGVMGVIARKHLNLDVVLNEAMRFMGTNDDEFLAYHFNELLNPNPISVEPGDTSIKGVVGRLRHIVWHTRFDDENDYCFNGASYDLHSPINVVFSPETKFAYFMAKKKPDESIDGWENSPLFADPDSEWAQSQKLLKEFGLSSESTIPLDRFLDAVRKKYFQQIAPTLQHLYQQNPEAVTREIADRFRNTRMEDFLPDLEKILGPVELHSPTDAGKESTRFSDYFKKIRERLRQEESTAPEYELHRLPTKTGSDDVRYAVISDNAWNFGNIENHLTESHPVLTEAT